MRSLLFVPGDSERKIGKALTAGADVLIFDLEDSVAAGNKEAARTTVRTALQSITEAQRATGPQFYVRVNALDSGWTEGDLEAVLPGRPDGIMQPKTGSAADVVRLSELLDGLEASNDLAAGGTKVLAIVTETAASLFSLGTYGDAGPRLQGMAWGAEDLSADLGASSNKNAKGFYTGPYQLARTLCLAGAVAARCEPVDTVYVNFRDEAGLRQECEAAMRDGFTSKLAIHPAQVPVINQVFTPSGQAIERARRIVTAFAEAGNAGVIGVDGEMLDRPHLTRAEKLLARAERYRG